MQCAYLNTFYNAKTAFNKAFKAHMKLKSSVTDTTVELTDEIKTGYERAIKKSTKVLDVYPKRRRWHDEAVFLKAKSTFYLGEYSTAARRFKQFQKEYPNSPYIPESYLFLGKAYLEDNSLQKADETFQFILEKYPKLNKNEEITLLLAQVAIKREGKSQAVRILEESLRSVKSDERKFEIIIKLCDLYIDLGLCKKTIALIKKAPRNKDFQNYLFRIDFYHLTCLKKMAAYAEALALAEKMMKNNQYVKQVPKIFLEKGIIIKAMGRVKEAVEIFREITEGTGANEIKGRAWFQLALIYQFEYGDYEKAKEAYEKVVSLTVDPTMVETANKRITGINQRLEYLEKIGQVDESIPDTVEDTVAESKSLLVYKLGEIFWLNLAEPDSALLRFSSLSSDSTTDSSLVMKSLYARAWILRFIKEDTVTADSLYTLIIERYPATIVAQKAQQDLGVPITVQTREDSARNALIEAERLYFEKSDAVASANAYYKVANTYPDFPEIASNSIYAAAWLCDNVLNKNKKALMLYRKLCDSFPESELCLNEAKPRIQIVEDTLKVLEIKRKKKSGKRKKGKQTDNEMVSDDDDTTKAIDTDEVTPTVKDITDTLSENQSVPPNKIAVPRKPERQKIIRKRRPGSEDK